MYYISDMGPLCVNFDTHLIEYVNYLSPVISVHYRLERRLHNKLRLLSNQKGYILVIA